MNYLHNHNIQNLDIRPSSILKGDHLEFKLVNLNFCFLGKTTERVLYGDQKYYQNQTNKEINDEKEDVFCLGLLLYSLTNRNVSVDLLKQKRRILHRELRFD